MTESDSAVVLALMRLPGIGNVSINRVVAWAGDTDRALHSLTEASARDLLEVLPAGMEHCAEALSSLSDDSLKVAVKLIERTQAAGAQIVLASAGDYPEALRASLAQSAPPVIFVVGDLEVLLEPCASVVGTRRPSADGLSVARDCAGVFAEEGITVLSGGARGIDLAAHRGALDKGGRTVVVLPQGLLTYRGPRDILEGIDADRVVLLSEFVPDIGFSKHSAITRNGTIVALSKLVCVIEPGATGGSIRTARRGLELGRRVFVEAAYDAERSADELIGSGAQRLRLEDEKFDGARLLEAWAMAPDLKAGQAEMF